MKRFSFLSDGGLCIFKGCILGLSDPSSHVAFQWHHLCVCVFPAAAAFSVYAVSESVSLLVCDLSLSWLEIWGIYTVYTPNLHDPSGSWRWEEGVCVCECVHARTPTYLPMQQAPHSNAHSGQLLGSWWLVPRRGRACLHTNGCVCVWERHICPLPDDTLLISKCFPLSSSLGHLERGPLYYPLADD